MVGYVGDRARRRKRRRLYLFFILILIALYYIFFYDTKLFDNDIVVSQKVNDTKNLLTSENFKDLEL